MTCMVPERTLLYQQLTFVKCLELNGYVFQIHWDESRDSWWHMDMAKASADCDPVWLDAEDPLFMLYTRLVALMPSLVHADCTRNVKIKT